MFSVSQCFLPLVAELSSLREEEELFRLDFGFSSIISLTGFSLLLLEDSSFRFRSEVDRRSLSLSFRLRSEIERRSFPSSFRFRSEVDRRSFSATSLDLLPPCLGFGFREEFLASIRSCSSLCFRFNRSDLDSGSGSRFEGLSRELLLELFSRSFLLLEFVRLLEELSTSFFGLRDKDLWSEDSLLEFPPLEESRGILDQFLTAFQIKECYYGLFS